MLERKTERATTNTTWDTIVRENTRETLNARHGRSACLLWRQNLKLIDKFGR